MTAHILLYPSLGDSPTLFINLGRDILSQWKRVGFRATPRAPHSTWTIEIEL